MLNVIMIDLEMFKEDTRENLIRFRNFMDGLGICRPPQSQMHLYCPFTNTEGVEEDRMSSGRSYNTYVGDGITCFTPYSGHIDDPYIEHIWALRWGWVPGISNGSSFPNIYDISEGRHDIRNKMTLDLCGQIVDTHWGRDLIKKDGEFYAHGKFFKKIWIQPQTGFVVAYECSYFYKPFEKNPPCGEFVPYVITDQYTAYLLSLPAVKVPEIEEEQALSFERGDLDKVLDKISAEGIESLTQKEKDFLQACTKGFFGKLF